MPVSADARKKEILNLTSDELRAKAGELNGFRLLARTDKASVDNLELGEGYLWVGDAPPDYQHDIGVAMTDLFESVYGRGGKIKGGAWVLSTVEGGRDVASACLMWKGQSGQKHRSLKVKVILPRGEMARAITLCWVCAMLGVSDE